MRPAASPISRSSLDALEGAEKGFASAELQPAVVLKADRSKPDYTRIVPPLLMFTPESHSGLDFADLSIIGADGRSHR